MEGDQYFQVSFNPSTPDSSFSEFCLGLLPDIKEMPFTAFEQFTDAKDLEKLQTKCTCTRTKCLKLYCECFANGNCCSKNCECKNCVNTEKSERRKKAVLETLEKNPLAFEHSRLTGTRGCSCKRSGCLKNYCECYLNKINCSEICRCSKCKNTEI